MYNLKEVLTLLFSTNTNKYISILRNIEFLSLSLSLSLSPLSLSLVSETAEVSGFAWFSMLVNPAE